MENLPHAGTVDIGRKLTFRVNNTGGHTFLKIYNDRSDTGVNDASG
jgi:hypothetical protein